MSTVLDSIKNAFKKELKRDKALEEDMKLKNFFDNYEIRIKSGTFVGVTLGMSQMMFTNSYFAVNVSPTANCQTCSVAGIQHIFSFPDYINSFLKEICRVTNKKLMIVEIRQEYMCYVDEMINPDFIVMKNPYRSTNGNPMVLMMWNVSSLLE